MNTLSETGRIKASRFCRWFFLFVAVLVTILPLSQPVRAQERVFSLYLTLRDGNRYYDFEVRAGQDNKLYLEVRNTGSMPVNNIKLSAEAPEGWTVEIEPAEIAHLDRDAFETLDVTIGLPTKVARDEHRVTFVAEATEITRQTQVFWMTVKPAQFWLWVWTGVGVIVIAIFVLVYRRFGTEKSEA